MSKKSNILFLFSDHQAYYKHGTEQGVHIQRPNFDRVAAEGAFFSNAYSACPLCGPVRRSILTGLFPHSHGETQNDLNIHFAEKDTYLDVLSENGYKNYYYGKWHAGPGTAYDHGCEGFSYPSYSNPYTKEEYIRYLEEFNLPRPQIKIEHSVDFKRPFIKEGMIYEQQQEWCCEECSGILLTPKETHEAFFLAHLACEQIDRFAQSKCDEPFSMRVDFWGPHQPYFITKEFADLYNPGDIPEHPSFSENVYNNNKPEVYWHEPTARINKDNQIIYPNPLPWNVWQEMLARCYAQITMIDAASGLILDALERNGLLDNTMVICTTDHGDAIGSHGGRFDKGCFMIEEILRVPLAIRYPEIIPGGTVIHRPVSSVDFPVTMLDAAGLAFEKKVHGKSLLRDLRQTTGYAVSETFGHRGIHAVHFGRAITDGRYKYIYNRDQIEELYDLCVDPYELTNQIKNPNYASHVSRMKQAYWDWAVETGDTEGYYDVIRLAEVN